MTTTPVRPSTTGRENTRRSRTSALMAQVRECEESQRSELLDQVVVVNMPLADRIASSYGNRGVALEDLRQVAYVALFKASRRFDPRREDCEFHGYAGPTIRGELRKHFRDLGWMVRPTRRVQEVQTRANAVIEPLTVELRRAPRPSEIAERIDEPVDVVIEALGAEGCFFPSSLDHPLSSEEGSTTLGAMLGGDDIAMEAAEARAVLLPALRELSERDRQIVQMRFLDELTQREIAERIGVTQMQVSRLLKRILASLRESLGTLDTAAVA